MQFTEKKFNIPNLVGISSRTIEEHLKLYAGYVKHANLIQNHLTELLASGDLYSYEMSEIQRRFAFEYGGIRNHEYYFTSLEGGATPLSPDSGLAQALEKEFGSVTAFLTRFKTVALTRGPGWVILYYDLHQAGLVIGWVDEQHIGHLADARIVLALDMWEHSFVADYQPSGKKQYVEDFFTNLNWSVIEKNFTAAQK